MKKDIALVYMVAGMSSRFGGEVKQFARVGLNNETLIEYSLNQALKSDFSKIIFIVGDKTEDGFKKMFGDNYEGVPVFYAKQEFDSEIRNRPWGTVDALCCAKEFIDCPFVVCNGDDIYGESSFEVVFDSLRDNGTSATVGFRLKDMLSDNCCVNRGIFGISEDGYIESIDEIFDIEKSHLADKNLNPDSLCNVNLFGFLPNVFDIFEMKLESFKNKNEGNQDVECLIPVELSEMIKEKSIEVKLCATPDKWMGITGPEDVRVVRETILSQSV